ncbi:MAG TPA: ShlB/FhaC/HecB family hemolysin secretion/activation protein [Stellaceae bacterium]|nr:ShlB/FhaC/HecB family hemolysin secretion/activation protein [Stellaceae bacterium]
MASADAPAVASQPVDIEEYAVDGNSVLDTPTIENAVYPYLGPDRSPDDVEKAKDALEKAYQDKGYQAVQLIVDDPTPQDGVVHIRVVEMKVGRLRVTGSRYYSLAKIKEQAPSIQEGAVPNFDQLRQDVVALNDLPGREVTPTVRAGKEPGTLDVDLVVKDKLPIQAEVGINNQQSVSTTPLRVYGTVGYNNLWQLGHRLSFTFETAPENEADAKVFAATYLARFLGSPFSLQINGLISDSNVSTLGATDVVGKGNEVGIHGVWELPGSEAFTESVQAGIDYKDFNQLTSVSGGPQSPVPVTFFPVSITYSGNYREETATDSLNATFSVALPRVGSSRADFDADRYNARGQELYFRGAYERRQDLPADFKVHARIEGQVTDEPLISNDQFPLGGFHSVRGYYESEVLVDTGFSGTLELITPSVPELLKGMVDTTDTLNAVTLFAFLDGGQGHILSSLPQQKADFSLASYGFGADAALFDHVQGTIDLAMPLITAETTRAGAKTILFRVATEY